MTAFWIAEVTILLSKCHVLSLQQKACIFSPVLFAELYYFIMNCRIVLLFWNSINIYRSLIWKYKTNSYNYSNENHVLNKWIINPENAPTGNDDVSHWSLWVQNQDKFLEPWKGLIKLKMGVRYIKSSLIL